jgi:hypothetical protein
MRNKSWQHSLAKAHGAHNLGGPHSFATGRPDPGYAVVHSVAGLGLN